MSRKNANRKSSPGSNGRYIAPAVMTAVWENGGAHTECLESRVFLSSNWFVSPNGSNQNPGTLSAPFQTIEAAANVAKPGDHVEIETGTYHETVAPANSGTASNPIVFEAYNGENVTISGADAITNWSNYSGNIYKAPMPWDLGEGNNEVFVNGQAINEARWPNTSLDLMNPTEAQTSGASVSGTSATISDPALTQPAGYWDGAIIHITDGQEWEAQTGTVTSSAPGKLTFSFTPGDNYELPTANNPFYLTSSFKTLNAAGEWYRDPTTGQLYLWTPGGENPSTDDIEVKERKYAFDLSNRSNITINNINIFSATINTTKTSANTVINGINATYISQFVIMARGWQTPSDSGICLEGPNSTLENSTIQYSSGDGVFVSGAGSRITNNVIQDVDYNAGNAAGIWDVARDSEVDHNTVHNVGRDCIYHAAASVQIIYNTVYAGGLLTTDNGAIYTVNTNGQGSIIAYNTVYDMHGGGFHETGIYLDNNSSNYIVHDNLVYDVDDAMKMNFTSDNEDIYNNSLTGSEYAVIGNLNGDWTGTVFADNVLGGPSGFGQGVTLRNNSAAAKPGNGPAPFVSGANITNNTGTGGSTSTITGGSTSTSTTTGGTSTTSTGGTTSSGTGTSGSTTSGSGTSGSTSTTTGGSTSTGTTAGGTSTTGTSETTSSGTGTSGSTTSGSGTSGSTSTTTGGSTSTGTTTGGTSTTGTGSSGVGSSGSTASGSGTSGSTSTGANGSTSTGTSTGGTSTGGTIATGTGGTSTTTSGSGTSGSTSTGTSTGGTSSTGTNSTDTGGSGTTTSGPTTTTGTGSNGSSSTGTSATASTGASASDSGSSGTDTDGGGSTSSSSSQQQQTPPVVSTTNPNSADGSSTATPTLGDMLAKVKADRAAVLTIQHQQATGLGQLIQTRGQDAAATRATSQKLQGLRHATHHVGSGIESADEIASLTQYLQQQQATVSADTVAIKTARQNDRLAIRAARKLVIADAKAYAVAKRRSAA